jgi:DNA-binding NarL/FixJ family response regulator
VDTLRLLRVEGAPHVLPSPRELEVLQLIATGASNKEIAYRLEMAVRTVKSHVATLIQGLNLNNRVELCIWVLSHLEIFRGEAARATLPDPPRSPVDQQAA